MKSICKTRSHRQKNVDRENTAHILSFATAPPEDRVAVRQKKVPLIFRSGKQDLDTVIAHLRHLQVFLEMFPDALGQADQKIDKVSFGLVFHDQGLIVDPLIFKPGRLGIGNAFRGKAMDFVHF